MDGGEGDGDATIRELLRSNEALRSELAQLRASHARLETKLAGAILGGRAEAETRRAALNLMEDAIDARRAEQRENEQRRRVERDLRAANRRKDELLASLAHANRAKDAFLAVLSHELRTPLAAILLWAGALRSGAISSDELSRAIDAILDSADGLSKLIDDLLDLSRVASDKLTLSPSCVEPARVMRTALDMIKPMAVAKGIVLEEDIEQASGTAQLDAGRTKQILGNLLTNAVKFSRPGGRIGVSMHKRDDNLEIEVSDDGQGIDPEFIPHLFEKFSQADMEDTRQHMGLGIGLALTKELVELHGGTIEAESEGSGKGARFRIRIPWRTSVAVSTTCERAEAADVHSPLGGLRVLIVEDDLHTREAMSEMLAGVGATVIQAGTAADALVAARNDATDVIVSDLGLPGMNGLEFIEHLSRECEGQGRRRPPSCALSAHARDADRKRAIEAGFDMYVPKPITPERLIEAVSDLRDIFESQQQ